MGSERWAILSGLFIGLQLLPSLAHGEETFWSTKAVLKEFFTSSERVSYVTVDRAAFDEELTKILGYRPKKERYAVFVAKTKDRVDGYAVIDDELGQHEPITFAVKLTADGLVARTEVMVYREGYGGEIQEARFRRQFEGKSSEDPLKVGHDIVAISGATISARSMCIGVRRAVALVKIAKREAASAPPVAKLGAPSP